MFGEEKSLTTLTATFHLHSWDTHTFLSLWKTGFQAMTYSNMKKFGELGKHWSHDFSTHLMQLQTKWGTPESLQQSLKCCPFRLWTRHILRTLKFDSTVSLLLKRQERESGGWGGREGEGGRQDRQTANLSSNCYKNSRVLYQLHLIGLQSEWTI